jgi:hypothetical protein
LWCLDYLRGCIDGFVESEKHVFFSRLYEVAVDEDKIEVVETMQVYSQDATGLSFLALFGI